MEDAKRTGKGLWNIREAAGFLHSTAQGVYKLVEYRKIPHVRLGRKILFQAAQIRAWVEEHIVRAEG